jgi:Ni/Fe-hydrogenase 1 B-type cytochrome subunit
MKTEPIRQVQIWSGWLRLAHWLIACGVLFELFSAWALAHGATDTGFWRDWHLMIGQLVALALLLRGILLFVPGTAHWRALIPGRAQWQAIRQMLRFYLSLARAPLPAWYAHNPFWSPVYLLVLLALTLVVVSGFLHDTPWRITGLRPAALHAGLGQLLAWFSLLHVVAAALHDWKGDGALISALFSGKRYFHINRQQRIEDPLSSPGIAVQFTMKKPPVAEPDQERRK